VISSDATVTKLVWCAFSTLIRKHANPQIQKQDFSTQNIPIHRAHCTNPKQNNIQQKIDLTQNRTERNSFIANPEVESSF
jgi:hypothetical protein